MDAVILYLCSILQILVRHPHCMVKQLEDYPDRTCGQQQKIQEMKTYKSAEKAELKPETKQF